MTLLDPKLRRKTGDEIYARLMSATPLDATAGENSTLLTDSVRDFVFGEVWNRPGLDIRARRWIALSCAGASGSAFAIDALVVSALQTGDISLEEMREFVLHFAVYCGWPKAAVIDDSITRMARRLELAPVQTAPLQAAPRDPQQRMRDGAASFESVMTFPGPQPNCAYYQGGILNFVFGEMWDRPALERKSRRWITLACVAVSDTVGPIQSHIYAAMNSSQCSLLEMQEFVLQFAVYAGWPKASILQATVEQMWARIENGQACFDQMEVSSGIALEKRKEKQ